MLGECNLSSRKDFWFSFVFTLQNLFHFFGILGLNIDKTTAILYLSIELGSRVFPSWRVASSPAHLHTTKFPARLIRRIKSAQPRPFLPLSLPSEGENGALPKELMFGKQCGRAREGQGSIWLTTWVTTCEEAETFKGLLFSVKDEQRLVGFG